MRTRIDRFVEDALVEFNEWYVEHETWHGKERDCVNLFAMKFLARKIHRNAAIKKLSQLKIECAVPQPRDPAIYKKVSACKDLVIWNDQFDTTWNDHWQPVNYPRVVMEWKTIRAGASPENFNGHDMRWLQAFTSDAPHSIGYLVQLYGVAGSRKLTWAKVARGKIRKKDTRS